MLIYPIDLLIMRNYKLEVILIASQCGTEITEKKRPNFSFKFFYVNNYIWKC